MGDCSLEGWHGHGTKQMHRKATNHTALRELVTAAAPKSNHYTVLETEIGIADVDGTWAILSIYLDDNGKLWLDIERCG